MEVMTSNLKPYIHHVLTALLGKIFNDFGKIVTKERKLLHCIYCDISDMIKTFQ